MIFSFESLAHYLLDKTGVTVKAYQLTSVDQMPRVIDGSFVIVSPVTGGVVQYGTMDESAMITVIADSREDAESLSNKVIIELNNMRRSNGLLLTRNDDADPPTYIWLTNNGDQLIIGVYSFTTPIYGIDPIDYKHYSQISVAYFTDLIRRL